jgi:hypothetical protein
MENDKRYGPHCVSKLSQKSDSMHETIKTICCRMFRSIGKFSVENGKRFDKKNVVFRWFCGVF